MFSYRLLALLTAYTLFAGGMGCAPQSSNLEFAQVDTSAAAYTQRAYSVPCVLRLDYAGEQEGFWARLLGRQDAVRILERFRASWYDDQTRPGAFEAIFAYEYDGTGGGLVGYIFFTLPGGRSFSTKVELGDPITDALDGPQHSAPQGGGFSFDSGGPGYRLGIGSAHTADREACQPALAELARLPLSEPDDAAAPEPSISPEAERWWVMPEGQAGLMPAPAAIVDVFVPVDEALEQQAADMLAFTAQEGVSILYDPETGEFDIEELASGGVPGLELPAACAGLLSGEELLETEQASCAAALVAEIAGGGE